MSVIEATSEYSFLPQWTWVVEYFKKFFGQFLVFVELLERVANVVYSLEPCLGTVFPARTQAGGRSSYSRFEVRAQGTRGQEGTCPRAWEALPFFPVSCGLTFLRYQHWPKVGHCSSPVRELRSRVLHGKSAPLRPAPAKLTNFCCDFFFNPNIVCFAQLFIGPTLRERKPTAVRWLKWRGCYINKGFVSF